MYLSRALLLAVTAALLALAAGPAAAAVDMFIQIDGIPGESQDPAHGGEIDVLSWSVGATHFGGHLPPNDRAGGGGGGGGKVGVQDLSFTKYVDKSSAKIQQACSNGTHFEEALLTVRKAGGEPLEYLTIRFSDLIVTSVQINGPGGGEDRLTENVTLNFRKFEGVYQPPRPDGTLGEPIPMEWDASRGRK